jgi:hypothetical protein
MTQQRQNSDHTDHLKARTAKLPAFAIGVCIDSTNTGGHHAL